MRPYFTIPSSDEQFDYSRVLEILGPCMLWQGALNQHGYGVFGRHSRAHRAAVEQVLRRTLKRTEVVLHACDTPACVRSDGASGTYVIRDVSYQRFGHLVLATQIANLQDATDKGRACDGSKIPVERRAYGMRNARYLHPERTARGERSAGAKLTGEKVRQIRMRHAAGETQTALALDFGVGQTCISAIVHRKNWTHIV